MEEDDTDVWFSASSGFSSRVSSVYGGSSPGSDHHNMTHDAESKSDESYMEYSDGGSEDADTSAEARDRRYDWAYVATYRTYDECKAIADAWDGNVYTQSGGYKTRYLQAWILICRSHLACEHRVKIKREMVAVDEHEHSLYQSGCHSKERIVKSRHGIHSSISDEVDAMLHMGMPPAQVRSYLMHKYASDPFQLAATPSSKQLENRKYYLSPHEEGGWDLTTFGGFSAWASDRLCDTKDKFMAVTDSEDKRMDYTLVLDAFMMPGGGEDGQDSFAIVVTSRRVFCNLERSREAARLRNRWNVQAPLRRMGLIDCGTETVVWEKHMFAHRFIPWAYMFTRSESITAYSKLFETIRTRARQFVGVDVTVGFGSLDHSEAIATALKASWPSAKLLLCWPHLVRQAKTQASLLTGPTLYKTMIKPHLDLLRVARSHEQFLRMAEIITDHWIKAKERPYATWFRSVYLTQRWERWHVNEADVPGIIPSQQGIESHHAVIKKTCVPTLRASTTGVANGIIPRILKYDGEKLCPASLKQYCEAPVPPEMFVKAGRLVNNSANYMRINKRVNRSSRLQCILFNVKKHISDGGKLRVSKVDKHRADRFIESLQGHIPDGISASELKFEVLSLHRVSIKGSLPRKGFTITPVWSAEVISRIRALLACTCTSFVRSGWVCSHVIATLALTKLINLETALHSVPVRNLGGRPTKKRAPLVKDGPHDTYFSVGKLRQRFKTVGYPMHWNVMDLVDVDDARGDTVSMAIAGVVEGVYMGPEGHYLWSASYGRHGSREYNIDELISVVRRAYKAGMQVIPTRG